MRTVDFTGTVSEATMRVQDVLPAIMGVLGEYHPTAFNRIQYDIAFGNDRRFTQVQASIVYSEVCGNDAHSFWDSELASAILNEDCRDAMQDIAPGGFYFGAHPGDGCDCGFWKAEEDEW